MKNRVFLRASALVFVVLLFGCAPWHKSVYTQGSDGRWEPAAGYIRDAEAAIAVAVAVWEPIYGKDHIANQAPYTAALVNDVWIVNGTLPEATIGGVATAEISKGGGRILRVSHGR
jgi:hypothetical protein